MCRWAAYLGEAVFLEDIVTAPCHSLIAQSHCAQEAKSPTNGDGFGLALYGDRPEPGLYRDILPAWSDPNLKSLCRQIRSSLFLAHVRASTGGATSRMNCHPFTAGRWSFMHNGQIGGLVTIRRALENSLSDAVFAQREGTTDSELFFLLMIAEGLSGDPEGAVLRATSRVMGSSRRAGFEPALDLPPPCRTENRSMRYAMRPMPTRRRSTPPSSAMAAGDPLCRSLSTLMAATGSRSRPLASSPSPETA